MYLSVDSSTGEIVDLYVGPMTPRTGDELAGCYGFASLSDLCDDIPLHAEVADIGSGNSNFGHMVARKRPDIEWTNFDIRYGRDDISDRDQRLLSKLRVTTPKNVNYVGGNILDPPRAFKERRFARVFSFYMMPHIIGINREHAVLAARNMVQMSAPNGVLSIGPIESHLDSVHVAAPSELTPEELDRAVTRIISNVRGFFMHPFAAHVNIDSWPSE